MRTSLEFWIGFNAVVLVLLIREFRAYRRRVFLRNYGYPPHP